MPNETSANATELMSQASETAHTYFHAAISSIDGAFGDGYAKAHPELVGAFMQTAAKDFHASINAQALENGAEKIARALESSL